MDVGGWTVDSRLRECACACVPLFVRSTYMHACGYVIFRWIQVSVGAAPTSTHPLLPTPPTSDTCSSCIPWLEHRNPKAWGKGVHLRVFIASCICAREYRRLFPPTTTPGNQAGLTCASVATCNHPLTPPQFDASGCVQASLVHRMLKEVRGVGVCAQICDE